MHSAKKILLALAIFTIAAALPTPQLAGEGQALDSILTDTDDGFGHGIENALNNAAGLVSGTKGGAAATGSSGSSAPPPPPPPHHRRQADKIAHGLQNFADAAGVGSSTTSLTNAIVNLDGASTSGAANIGAEVGGLEDSTLQNAGNLVPRV